MIDLHNHTLPELDDGSSSLAMSLEMARIAVADGITHVVCTPHAMPGVYDNDRERIGRAVQSLARELARRDVDLSISIGADIHISPDLVERISTGKAPTLGGTRYFLLEPPHHVQPPGLVRLVERAVSQGYVPIVTHPERLAWIEYHYSTICGLQSAGALLQLTAASLTGGFGKRPRYWSERMLDEGLIAVIATDAHDPRRRPPILSRARDMIAARWNEALSIKLTVEHPRTILANRPLLPEVTGGASQQAADPTTRQPRPADTERTRVGQLRQMLGFPS